MTGFEKFERFETALKALCIEFGTHLEPYHYGELRYWLDFEDDAITEQLEQPVPLPPNAAEIASMK
jgi:hypothetical protein